MDSFVENMQLQFDQNAVWVTAGDTQTIWPRTLWVTQTHTYCAVNHGALPFWSLDALSCIQLKRLAKSQSQTQGLPSRRIVRREGSASRAATLRLCKLLSFSSNTWSCSRFSKAASSTSTRLLFPRLSFISFSADLNIPASSWVKLL